MEKKHKKISAVFVEHIKRLSRKRQRNIWKAVAFYWQVHLYERHKQKKIKPDIPDYELIQQAAINVYGKEKTEPVLNTLLELGIQPHPFNTLIYEAANNVPPTAIEKIHSFCFGCIIQFETDYREAVRELEEKGIIKRTRDQEWIDYLKKCNSYVPEKPIQPSIVGGE
jgi:hypothetical protein